MRLWKYWCLEDQMLFTLLIQIAKRNYWFRGWLTNLQWETEVNLAMSLHVLAWLHCQCISSMSWGRALLPWEARWSGAKEQMTRWGLWGTEQKPLIVGTSLCCIFFANQRMVPPGKSLMALNGALINIEDLDLCLYVLPYFLDSVVSYFYSLFYLSLAKSTLAICFLPWAYQNRLKSVYP